jgi:hypothetical protein
LHLHTTIRKRAVIRTTRATGILFPNVIAPEHLLCIADSVCTTTINVDLVHIALPERAIAEVD